MKFNKATSKLLSEMDMSSTTGMRRNDKYLSGDNSESMRIRVMRNMGADDAVISRWRQAEAKGISFESFLLGLIDEIKNGKIDSTKNDVSFE